LGEKPGNGDLCRRRFEPFRYFTQAVNQRTVGLDIVGLKTWHNRAKISLSEGRAFVNLAGQKTLAERAEGHKTNSQFFERRKDILLRLTPK